jgi:predicted MFS family arabinose efflux permease
MSVAGYAIVLAVPRWWAVLAGSVFFISWTAISLPAIMSLVSSALPKNRRTLGVSLHSFIRRIPMALGPMLGGWIMTQRGVATGTRIAFAIAICFALLALWLQWKFIREEKKDSAPADFSGLWRRFDPSLRRLLVSDILIRFAEQIPYAFAVVWAVKICGLTPAQFGVLTAIEMATAMLIYLPVAWLADRGHKKPFVLITFVFFTAFPLTLFFAHTFWPLVFAFVIRGLKEFGEPTRKALIMDLAPEDAKAAAFGLYYLIRDLIVSVAAFGGAWLWQISPATNLFAAAGFGLAGTIYFAAFGRDLSRPAAVA